MWPDDLVLLHDLVDGGVDLISGHGPVVGEVVVGVFPRAPATKRWWGGSRVQPTRAVESSL